MSFQALKLFIGKTVFENGMQSGLTRGRLSALHAERATTVRSIVHGYLSYVVKRGSADLEISVARILPIILSAGTDSRIGDLILFKGYTGL